MMGSHVSAKKLVSDYPEYDRKAEDFKDEHPRHMVEITKPFLMSATEVTVGQFRAFVEQTGYKTRSETDGNGGWGFDPQSRKCIGREPRFSWRNPGYPQTDNHPVVNVTWEDCQAYCRWLSTKENRIVRLPTEAEWEYSNRANTQSYYQTGNTQESVLTRARTLEPTPESIRNAIQNLDIDPDNPPFPLPVGSYAPNGFGLYDMHGNVWEWTADWYDENYYSYSPIQDPKGPRQGTVKVRRGGAWNSFPMWSRSSFRNWNDIDTRCANLGFRVVGELTPFEISEYQKSQPIRLLFVGDIMLDNGPGNAIANGLDPFEHCAKILLDADVTIGNLECVLGRAGHQRDKPYVYRGASDSPKFLKKYFHGLSLANNHTLDFGPEGLLDCLEVLEKADIGYFGAGQNIDSSRAGLLLEVKGRRIMLLGYNDFLKQDYEATENRAGNTPLNNDWVVDDIARAKSVSNADIVIPFVHWGNEMNPTPSPDQQTQAKRWIDAGASAVIGGHPHVTQTIDSHRGRPIVYSLGNFVFDYYEVDPLVWYGWAIRLTIQPESTASSGTIDWETITVELDPRGLPRPVDPEE
jgi:formylglycine-generating enzyme required for sulfatase activity